jgi:hypothetical protein
MELMNSKSERSSSRPSAGLPVSRKRFRIEKLEQRIAPAKGGNGTKNCGGSGGTGSCTSTWTDSFGQSGNG